MQQLKKAITFIFTCLLPFTKRKITDKYLWHFQMDYKLTEVERRQRLRDATVNGRA